MSEAIGAVLPLAIGVAISPIPIIAVILMLFSARARENGIAFLAGWVAALLIVGAIVLVLAAAGRVGSDDATSNLAALVKALLGALFLFLAVRQWGSRPAEGVMTPMPSWMAAIDSFTMGRSLGLAGLLAGVNPKNLALTTAAGLAIAQAGVSGASAVVALLAFVAVASLSVAIPVLYYLAAGEGAKQTLDGWKAWLLANNAAVMAVLFVVLGFVLLGQGIAALSL
ncbi:MAG TPA: GAP family protein [Anaerolineae bacterium]|nr:GAP family protein [Anaerolineae bacterium]